MTEHGYWHRYPIGRRRFLAAAGSLGLSSAALALLACNPRDEDSEPPVGSLVEPVNSTSSAIAGGTLKTTSAFDTNNFDPLATSSPQTFSLIAAYTYPRLLKFKSTTYPDNADGSVEGDLVESFEFSPDRLQLTLRLRQGLKWDTRPPTNGRVIDAQDVMSSWSKFTGFSPFRNDLAFNNDQAPGSPIETITSPDTRTILVRLKYVDSAILSLLAADRPFYVMPRESHGGFDPRFETRGYGPWLLAENRAGLRSWSRNPEYHVKGRPFYDRIEVTTISDYTARLAQFKAGEIYTSVASQDDLLGTRRELPELLLRKVDAFSVAPSVIGFGYNEAAWRDERMRQAITHLIDRETLIDLRTNRRAFAMAGLVQDVRYHTAVGAGWEGYWVDPQDESRFGPNARYFRFDIAEAKRLMSAAGYPAGVETVLHYNGGNEYGPGYTRSAELLAAMLRDGGVNASPVPHDFAGDWQPNYLNAYSAAANPSKPLPGFAGIAFRTVTAQPVPALQLFSTLHRSGSRFHGMTPDGKNPHLGDPELNRMLEEIRREFDIKRQQSATLDVSRFVARKSYDIPFLPFAALNFSLTWPVIGNFGVYRGWPGGSAPTETALHNWLDTTKRPIAPKAN